MKNPLEHLKQDILDVCHNSSGGCYDGVIDILNEVELTVKTFGDGWISIHDELPPEYADVLVFEKTLHYIVCARYKGGGKWEFEELLPPDIKVTHWQPLPQPPKE